VIKKQLEIEVKFFLEDPGDIYSRLIEIGAQPHERLFEKNTCYDHLRDNYCDFAGITLAG
jgi:adenylate cyclase class IV